MIEVIYQIFILIDQRIKFPSREKDRYPNSVKSHLSLQFFGLKSGKIADNFFFSEKD